MKYIIIIFLSISMCFGCGQTEKKNVNSSQEPNSQTEQISENAGGNKAKNKVKKAGSKLPKRYKAMIDQNILTQSQAIRLREIERNFTASRQTLRKNKQWSGKANASNRRKFNADRSELLKSEFGEETAKRLQEYQKSLNQAKKK